MNSNQKLDSSEHFASFLSTEIKFPISSAPFLSVLYKDHPLFVSADFL